MNAQDAQKTNEKAAAAARQKLLLKDIRVTLDGLSAGSPGRVYEAQRGMIELPKAEELAAARSRLETVNGVEMLVLLRSNPGYFASKLFANL